MEASKARVRSRNAERSAGRGGRALAAAAKCAVRAVRRSAGGAAAEAPELPAREHDRGNRPPRGGADAGAGAGRDSADAPHWLVRGGEGHGWASSWVLTAPGGEGGYG